MNAPPRGWSSFVLMSDEKMEFSKRLHAALRAKGLGVRPVDLEKRFNSNYGGPSVSFQTVSGWLGGRSIPRPDKLRVLADLVDLEPHVLRDGGRSSFKIREQAQTWPGSISEADRVAVEALLALPPQSRKLVRELILALREGTKAKSR